jgi:hypothetical protein
LLALAVQLLIPIVLWAYSLDYLAKRIKCDQDDNDDLDEDCSAYPSGVFHDDSTLFCTRRNNAVLGRAMMCGVLLCYTVTVLPDQINRFYQGYGQSDDTRSKLSTIRNIVYDQDEDGIYHKIGYLLDCLMNTSYVCVLYLLTLFIIYTYDDPAKIILNSLAIQFVNHIDEAVTAQRSYDRDHRLLKAGAVEMVLQSYIDIHELRVHFKMHSAGSKSSAHHRQGWRAKLKSDAVRKQGLPSTLVEQAMTYTREKKANQVRRKIFLNHQSRTERTDG